MKGRQLCSEYSCLQATQCSVSDLWRTQLLMKPDWFESFFGLLVLSQFWGRHLFNNSLEIHTGSQSKQWHVVVYFSLTAFTTWAQALPFSLLFSVPLKQFELLPQMCLLSETYSRVILMWWLQWLTCYSFMQCSTFQSRYCLCFILSTNAYSLGSTTIYILGQSPEITL